MARPTDSPDTPVAALASHGPQATIRETVRGEGWDARLAEVERHLTPILSPSAPRSA
jgi:hypothetical protein